MSNKNELKKKILYEMNSKVYTSDAMEHIFLIVLMSLPLLIWKYKNFVFLLLGILPSVLQFIAVKKLIKNGKIEKEHLMLYRGLTAINISMICEVTGIALALYTYWEKYKIAVISIGIICYISVAIICIYLTKHSIEKEMSNAGKMAKDYSQKFGVLGGMLGILISRIFFQGMSNETLLKILCAMCFFMACVAMVRVDAIVKYYYVNKILSTK